MTRRPGMVDVAKVAGVSHVTVSRVLNDHPMVRPETRAKVEAAIAELGYRRNNVARALKSRRSSTLGILLAGSGLYELPHTLLGAERAAKAAGFTVSLASWQGGTAEELEEAMDHLVDQSVAGITIIADRPVATAALQALRPAVPTQVMMSGQVDTEAGLGFIEFDHVHGARTAVRHLIELGHRDIAHLAGTAGVYDAQARLQGWRDELAAHGLPEGELIDGDFTATSGYRWARAAADRPGGPPTAIFASNDQMALGVLAGFAESGLRVPDDVSVVGYDDQAGTEFAIPALTTVRQDFEVLGAEAMTQLLTLVDGAEPVVRRLEPTLIRRRSSAPPRS
ncbi:LacI family DNA-binding transcriptional regulator [Microbacteriaceae bacterium VKM Ac-2854]|nr:LacI family DNA-binding transcriptional regulator [Microbacteriaceae bacterium VKM Ac-2854]